MPRFYVNLEIKLGTTLDLPEEVVQHLKVLRAQVQDFISIFNGNGHSYQAQILNLHKKSCQIVVTTIEEGLKSSPNTLTLAMSIIALDKMDLVMRAATELGVAKIIPIITTYTQRINKERLEKRMEHWQKIIISSCEQCGQNTLPQLNTPQNFTDIVKEFNTANKFILSLSNATQIIPKKTNLSNYLLVVGPEGGFTQEEVTLAITQGFNAIKPWENILRAETAAIAGVSLLLNNLE